MSIALILRQIQKNTENNEFLLSVVSQNKDLHAHKQ